MEAAHHIASNPLPPGSAAGPEGKLLPLGATREILYEIQNVTRGTKMRTGRPLYEDGGSPDRRRKRVILRLSED